MSFSRRCCRFLRRALEFGLAESISCSGGKDSVATQRFREIFVAKPHAFNPIVPCLEAKADKGLAQEDCASRPSLPTID